MRFPSSTFRSPFMRLSPASSSVPRSFFHTCTETNRAPNHALQRTAPGVTVAASNRRLSPAVQLPRRPPQSLSLGSLGHSPRLLEMKASASDLRLTRFQSRSAFGVTAWTAQAKRSFWRQSARARLTGLRFSHLLQAMRFVAASFGSQVTRLSPESSTVLGRWFAELSTQNEWPNHALQRTRVSVTPAASCLRLSPATQQSRPSRVSLSLRSLGAFERIS